VDFFFNRSIFVIALSTVLEQMLRSTHFVFVCTPFFSSSFRHFIILILFLSLQLDLDCFVRYDCGISDESEVLTNHKKAKN